ncbi:hypothetical protein IWQ56_002109 [Coemansia nantahalensis]|uniref:Uncharacterized protein n=1 Tax=Coemansia nantahalensis TaxID=2789366 RepID=A0ACC1K433_9FUNG|nr:hypothetical protein IWQ56_002109 [Coemansia nantahalensis]KAJ2772923.1 hypothetical protein IWQ57_001548 [Coemansia nantahalensis]
MSQHASGKRVRFAASSSGVADNGGSGSYAIQSRRMSDASNGDESDADGGLEADISTRRRRGWQVNTDGYGSDASEQDEAGNLSDFSDDQDERDPAADGESEGRRAGAPDAGSDNDMFADDDGDAAGHGDGANGSTDNKRKRYLDIDDIEGQEMSSVTRTEHASAGGGSSSKGRGKQREHSPRSPADSDSDDTDRVKIEAFNMRDDLEEGAFDVQGNFVWNKKDPQAYQDSWLDGVSKGAIQRARESKARQEQAAHAGGQALQWDRISNDDLVLAVINILRPHETVFAALARIGGPKKKTKNKWSRRARAKQNDVAIDDGHDAERKLAIERLTELADQAMARGMAAIYDDTYEQLVRHMRMAGRIPDDWEPGTALPTAADAGAAPVPAADGGDDGLLDDLL